MRGSRATRLWIALGVAAAIGLGLWGSGVFGDAALDGDASGGEVDPVARLEREWLDELQRGPGLRGLPGIDARPVGVGLLTGRILLHVPGEGPRPLPGVAVHVIGNVDGANQALPVAESDAEGVFTLEQVPAGVGYVVIVDHAPYRRVVLRALGVAPDRATDVGAIVLGAPTSLAGEVVDAKGRAIRGATVQVLRDVSREQSFDLRRALFELQLDAAPLAQAAVDADGRFLLEDLPPGRYVLRASAPGHATTFRAGVLVTFDERSSAVRVVLDGGAGFEGRVTDETGRGLGGARVIAVALPGRNLQRFDRDEVVTDGSGRYRIDTLIPGMTYAVEAWAEGYAPTGSYVREVSGIKHRDWKLAPSGRIEGRVLDAVTGAGIPDCQVTVVAGPLSGVSPVSATTDGEGAFVLPHVNPGPILLFAAKAKGYQAGDGPGRGPTGQRVESGETTWIQWTLQPGGALWGRITAEGGRPVPYASVALVDRSRHRQRWTGELTAVGDADGAYRLVGVQAGDYDLRVTAAGHAAPGEPETTWVHVGPELGEIRKDVVLTRGAVVEGSVASPAGDAVRGARVWLEAPDGKRDDALRDLEAVSGGDGTFRIAGVPPRGDVVVRAEHDAWVRSKPARVSVGGDAPRRVALVLREGARLAGRVADVRGAPVEGARVRWGNVDGVPERDLRSSFEADEYLGARVVRSDGDGRFELGHLRPGTLMVKVEQDGYSAWYRRDLAIGEDADPPAITVELQATLTVSGRVTSAVDGRPLAGAFVYARERSPGEGVEPDPGRVQAVVSTETDAAGRYVLEKVPPGLHEIVVWFAEGHVAAMQQWRDPKVRRRDVAAGSRGVDFALDPIPAPATDR